MIKIALVDDHVVLRKSLGLLIEIIEEFRIIIQADTGLDFIRLLDKNNLPDIVLMDISMPNMDGIATTKWLQKNHPSVKVVVLSMIENEFIVIRMLKNGVRGYILKDCDPSELNVALKAVNEKGYYFNDIITPKMKYIEKANLELKLPYLTNGELTFLRWACSEKTYKQIAAEMNLSHRTIDGYRDSLFEKLKVNSRVGIALYAIKSGIVQI